ncbi:helix-turn-helix domain-containing protein [Echinicola vietnamensis]|uniref:Helix-turn-helix protein n=1 Tax=Echinicola vietnamensis (strain DSM 17526 / LMG 23754 / KMM 6221) TaxID=926556 RepID=L0FYX1_ECHVK|nr:helix-turn-helix transcriptional regulator [Echinicola vietnamensis]AGA78243.1 Helix-turn-helix protein [Echinicola vietnamensis DSM 17526]
MEKELKQHIAENLRKYRVLRGFTQEYIADYLGKKDYTAYSRYEQGRSNLKMDDAIKLSELYDVQIQELVNGSPSIKHKHVNGTSVQGNHFSVMVSLDGSMDTLENQLKRLKRLNTLIEHGEV